MNQILFLLGTAREGRKSELVAQYLISIAQSRSNIKPILVDIRDYPQSTTKGLTPELASKWTDLITNSQAIVIIAPEYNHSYPGELKLLLDSELNAYRNKPVAICATSAGTFGGARMAEHLKLLLLKLQMRVINNTLYFANLEQIFNNERQPNDPNTWDKRTNEMLDQLLNSLN